MAKIIISESGNKALDGEYPLDAHPFTNREWHVIKEISKVRPGEFNEAVLAADNDLVLACAQVALQRAGKHVPMDVLWELEGGLIVLDLRPDNEEEQEGDAGPPEPSPTERGEPESAVVRPISSGADSKRSSESQDDDRSSTGDQTSETLSQGLGSA